MTVIKVIILAKEGNIAKEGNVASPVLNQLIE